MTWNLKILFSENQIKVALRLLTLVVALMNLTSFILISKVVSIEHQKLWWESGTPLQLICGHLAVFFMNYSLAILFFKERMKKSKLNALWKWKVSPHGQWLCLLLVGKFSSMMIIKHYQIRIQKARPEYLVQKACKISLIAVKNAKINL